MKNRRRWFHRTGGEGQGCLNVDVLKANDACFVKNLLNLRKETAVVKILSILPNVSVRNVEVKTILLKILPVYFSYAEVFGQNLSEVIRIIRMLQAHPLFVREKSLFNAWYVRLLEANRKSVQRCTFGDSMQKNGAIAVLAKICTNKFVSIPGTDFIDPIGYAELDFFNSYHRFLKFHKLHKYLYFFANLSYIEITNINESNIRQFEEKVDIFPMTTGARNAILRKIGELNYRTSRLDAMKEWSSLSDVVKIEETLEDLKTILRTPIRGCTIYTTENDLPDLLAVVIERISARVQHHLSSKDQRILPVVDQLIFLLKRAWSCYFFTNEQKLLFNQLRSEITMLKKNFHMNGRRYNLLKPKRVNIVQSQKFQKDMLDELISYMEQWLSKSAKY